MNIFRSAKELWDFVETFRNELQQPLKNGYILQLYFDTSKNATQTSNKLHEKFGLSNDSVLKLSVVRVVNRVLSLKRALSRNSARIVEFLNSDFAHKHASDTDSQAVEELAPLELDQGLDTLGHTLVEPDSVSGIESRHSCSTCSATKRSCSERTAVLKQKLAKAKRDLQNIVSSYSVKKVNQTKKRLCSQLEKLKRKCTSLRRENKSLKKKLGARPQEELRRENRSLKRKLGQTEGKLDEETQEKKLLKGEVCSLRTELESVACELGVIDQETEWDEDQSSRVISDKLRKCIYFCLISNVPIQSTSPLIKHIGGCLGSDVKHLPHASTVARCAYELGIISDMQTANFMLQAPSLTLAWDATTLKGTHLNQIVVTSEEGAMVVTTDALAGGTGEDYGEHLVNSVCRVAAVYACFQKTDYTGVLNTLVSKFRCTMSDRASVNHCAAVRLMNQLQIQLLELNCQMHPLECFASAAREVLLTHERATRTSRSKTFGHAAGAVNVLAAISKLRYKDGKGDPLGFKVFLKAEKIDGRLLVRYVGNRLHVLFHLGASVFHLREKLLMYLKRCSQQALRLAVIADLYDDLIVTHLRVLGLFGKVVTGPWMTLMYGAETTREHMGKTRKVLECLDFIAAVSKDPDLLLTSPTNGFGQELHHDDVLTSLRAEPATDFFREAAAQVASHVHAKLERQLWKYREDPDYNPGSEEVQAQTSSASVHNMACERGLGMMDFLLRRSPNASVETLDAKARANLNKTMEWLEEKAEPELHKILLFARKEGARSRKKALKVKEHLERKMLQRQQEKGQGREMVARRQKEKEVLEAVTKNDVRELLDGADHGCRAFVNAVLTGHSGILFQHVWSTKDGKDDLFLARLGKPKMERNVRKVWISYWKDEGEGDAVDHLISVHSIITDALLGDLCFS